MSKKKVKKAKAGEGSSKPQKPSASKPKKIAADDLGSVSSKINVASDEVKVEVTQPEAKGVGFLEGLLSLKEDGGEDAAPKKKKRGRPPKAKGLKLEPQELANLLLVPTLLMAAKKFLPEPILPEDDEALGVCAPLARIIVRRMPTVPMSADAIDLGRMFIAGMQWRMRVQPIVEALREAEEKAKSAKSEGGVSHAPAAKPKGYDDGRHTEGINSPEPVDSVISGTPGRSGLATGGGATPH